MALYLHKNEINIEITKHKLIQVPDLKEAIINCIELTEYERKIQKKLTTSEITENEYYDWYQ